LGDAGRLQQVFWNLLANAIKFTPKGGHITVSLERVGRSVRIAIADTGQGIHSDFLPFVFDRFRQEDSSITRQFGGLGLGLAISRQIIEAHGGTITAASSGVGQGATFTIYLPLIITTQQTKLDSEPSHASLDLSGIKVLVAEDDAGTRHFLTFVLEQYGANVTAVADATDAIATIAQQQLDLLIIDIGMPKVDGYTLVRQIRMKPPEQGGTIPAIALTAFVGQQDRQQALTAGFQLHVPKPIKPAEFVAVVARLVGK
jgi:CheY-like chemotaxis protein